MTDSTVNSAGRDDQYSKLRRLRRQRNILLLPWVLMTFPVSVPIFAYMNHKRKKRIRKIGTVFGQSGDDRRVDTNIRRVDTNIRRVDTNIRRVDTNISNLIQMLWAGQSDNAIIVLTSIADDADFSTKQRLKIYYALITRQAFLGNMDQARQHCEQAKAVAQKQPPPFEILMRECQIEYQTGNLAKAKAAIDQLDPAFSTSDSKLALASTLTNPDEKLGILNQIFLAGGVTPIQRKTSDTPLTFSNIEGTAQRGSCPSLGKVSIIIPVHNGEHFVARAIESLCQQTYFDTEIIAVDDCSTDASHSLLKKLATQDNRILVLRTEKNSGAYPARNLGLKSATGDFITVHDADDWSHPEKIEHQVKAIVARNETVASASHWVRATEGLMFTGWRITDELIHWNHSSLMFEKRVLDTLGPWDSVRVGADSEYHSRICATFGDSAVQKILPQVPMSFGLESDFSLTRTGATHVSTYNHGARHIYREIAGYWLRRPATSLANGNTRKLEMMPEQICQQSGPTGPVHTLYLGDCRDLATVQKIENDANETSQIIAICHQPKFDLSIRQGTPFCDAYFELLMNDNIIAVVDKDATPAKHLVELD